MWAAIAQSVWRFAAGWTVRDRFPVAARFSVPSRLALGAHPASHKTATGSFPGVKRTKRGVDHPTPSSIEVKERVQLYLYSPSGPVLG